MDMRIATISNNSRAHVELKHVLAGQGIEAVRADLTSSVAETVREGAFDAVVLQHDSPDAVRNTLVEFRARGIDTPLIVISDQANVDMRVLVLRLGADDCLSVPYNETELVARIRAVVRRVRLKSREPILAGALTIDLDGKSVFANGKLVDLTVKEYDIFELLYCNRGTILTKTALIGRLYKGADEPMPKIIDVFICKLRRKLSAATGGVECIRTVWGTGYTWGGEGDARAA
jgi:two-component system cell cycle response regulator CtrA